MKAQSSCQEGKKYMYQDLKCSCENKDIDYVNVLKEQGVNTFTDIAKRSCNHFPKVVQRHHECKQYSSFWQQ